MIYGSPYGVGHPFNQQRHMLLYVITYDMACNRRRQKVADLLEGYGRRVQESVFECVLARDKYRELQQKLKRHFHSAEDSIRFYLLSSHTRDKIVIWGGPPVAELPRPMVI